MSTPYTVYSIRLGWPWRVDYGTYEAESAEAARNAAARDAGGRDERDLGGYTLVADAVSGPATYLLCTWAEGDGEPARAWVRRVEDLPRILDWVVRGGGSLRIEGMGDEEVEALLAAERERQSQPPFDPFRSRPGA